MKDKFEKQSKSMKLRESAAIDMVTGNKDLKMGDVWDQIKETNHANTKDIQKQMQAFGYSKGEIEEFLKTKVASTDKKDRIDIIKEEMYIRHKLRYRMLMDHVRDSNLLITLDHMRAEDQHLLDSLTKLGEIAPIAQGPTNLVQSLGIEQFIYAAHKSDTGKPPILKEAAPVNEASHARYEDGESD